MSLYEALALSYPEEQTDFGVCLLVPHSAFKPEWESQLKAEGVKIFSQSYNGKLFFFLKKPNQNETEKSEQLPQPQLKPITWNMETLQLIQKMRSEGLTFIQITEKLRQMGYKTSETRVRTMLKQYQTETEKNNSTPQIQKTNSQEDLLEEFVGALNLLTPKHKRIAIFLIENGAKLVNSQNNT